MEHEHWLMELVPLAEEIRNGKGTPAKSDRLAELILKLHNHLFNGGSLPQAWFVPMITSIGVHGEPPPNPFEDALAESGVHQIPEDSDIDVSCFDALEESDIEQRQTLRRLAPVSIR